MITTVIRMYITLVPLILTGILNMIFCTTKLCSKLDKPIDFGQCLKDNKRLFGDNKTYKGLVGYIIIGIITTFFWGIVCRNIESIEKLNYMYVNYDNTHIYNIIIGALLGLAYALFELPNSFVKRRCGIEPGKPAKGFKKYIFILLDQCDSIIGCVLVVVLVYRMSIGMYFLYVLLGILTHLVINMFLYFFKLRKNII